MSLASLAAQIVFNSMVGPRARPVKKLKAELAIMVLAGLLGSAGAVLLILALYQWLALYYAPPVAALIAGLALYIAAILLLIGARLAGGKRMRREVDAPSLEQKIESVAKLVEMTLGTLKREIATPVQDNPSVSLLVASIAGFLAARLVR